MSQDKDSMVLFALSAKVRITGAGKAFNRPPQDHPIHSLVGRIACEWSHLEWMLDRVIFELASIDQRMGACITGQMMGVWPRLSAIEALAVARQEQTEHFGEIRTLTKKLAKDCRPVSEKRNRIVHDPWYVEANSNASGRYRSAARSEKFQYGIKDEDDQDLQRTLLEIESLSEQANCLYSKTLDAMHKKAEPTRNI